MEDKVGASIDNSKAEVPLKKRVEVMKDRYAELYNKGIPIGNPVFYKHFGIKPAKFSTWIKDGGVQKPRDEDVEKLCKGLKMNFNYIKFGIGDPFPVEDEEDNIKVQKTELNLEPSLEVNTEVPAHKTKKLTPLKMAEIMLGSGTTHGELLKKYIISSFESFEDEYEY